MRKIGRFLVQWLSVTVFVAGILVALMGISWLIVVGGHIVANLVSPIEWPEDLVGNEALKLAAVLTYVSSLIGAGVGFWAAWKVKKVKDDD